MGFWDWVLGTSVAPAGSKVNPRADAGAGVEIASIAELAAAMRGDGVGAVSPESAMRVAAVYACVRVISGAVANLPLHVKERVDELNRRDVDERAVPLAGVLRRQPNRWQTPSTFRRMMQAHVLLRGNAYAMIVRTGGKVTALLPLHPDRVTVKQRDDLSVIYEYTRKNGGKVVLPQADVFHLLGLTLDGVHGLSVISYAREAIGLSLAMEHHGTQLFQNGARVSGVLSHQGRLSSEAVTRLRESLEDFRAGAEREGKTLILEEGMSYEKIAMTSEDAQWVESRKMSRTDIAMYFGVPPHMIGDTEKSTSWGTGIEQQMIGFITFTLEDHLTMWEQAINRALLGDEPALYARFNRQALLRGDSKARWDSYQKALQWGVFSPNEIRSLEDFNPRDGGDIYYPPPNMTRDEPGRDEADESARTA